LSTVALPLCLRATWSFANFRIHAAAFRHGKLIAKTS